jgi:hypothetical protein
VVHHSREKRQFVLEHQMQGVYRPTEETERGNKEEDDDPRALFEKRKRGPAWAWSKSCGCFSQRLGEIIRGSGAA